MTDISDDQVNDLLREAEERLARGKGKSLSSNAALTKEAVVEIQNTQQEADAPQKPKELSVRVTQPKLGDLEIKKKVSYNFVCFASYCILYSCIRRMMKNSHRWHHDMGRCSFCNARPMTR